MNDGAFSYSGAELGALAGARNYYRWILGRFRPHVGKLTIEVGAGIGTFSELLLAETALDRLIVVEPARNLFPRLERRLADDPRVTLVHGHVDDVPASVRADSAILVNVLEHVADVTPFLAALHARLTRDGRLLLLVPAGPRLYGSLDAAFGHHRRYTRPLLIVFAPSLGNGFVDWDDNLNFVSNPYYRGLGWPQLRWMLTATVTGHYIPLTWLTLGLDYLLWGMSPAGYHLTNVGLHALNAVIVTLIAFRLLRLARPRSEATRLWVGAAAAALFFALHPLRAESVAWVTERRGLLSACFALLTVLTYLRMCAAGGAGRRRWLVVSVGCYALALASKAVVVTLPFVLLVLDGYPLGRLGVRWWRPWASEARPVWREKIPYLLLAVVAGAIASAVVHARGVFSPIDSYPPSARLAMLSYGLVFYVERTLLPLGLSPLYELPERVSALDPWCLASIVAVVLLTGALALLRRRWPAGLPLWSAYALILIPVSGLLQAGHQLVADRYSYLACLPWALLVGAGVSAALDAAAAGRLRTSFAALASGAVAVWIVGLASLTSFQIQVWRDTETLWRHALEIEPACSLCHNQLGAELGSRGDVAPAAYHFERALALRPEDAGLRSNLGLALSKAGRPAEAIPHFARALERNPADVETRVHLGAALAAVGKVDEAIDQFRQAVTRNPGHARAREELARASRLK